MKSKEEIGKKIRTLRQTRDKETAQGVKALFNIEINALKWVLRE